jgi:hypothetical protein
MDKATQTMIENLQKNTGNTLEQWIEIARKEKFAKHGELVSFLKDSHGLTYGFMLILSPIKQKAPDAGSAENQDDLVVNQYKGKRTFPAFL